MRGHAAAVLYNKPNNGTINIDALQQAIIGKESGGDFSAVNPDSEALGYGQVMPGMSRPGPKPRWAIHCPQPSF